MYSPKEYVETVLSNALRDYVEEYEGSDFSFGLWQGDLSLSNLVLKPMTINIGDGMVSRMVFGSIDKLQVIIPWSQMSSGHVSVKVDTVNIVVQLSVDQSEDADHRATDTLLHKLKMAKIDSEERRLLGVSRSGGWKSRLMESLKSSVLSKLFSGMSAEVNKLKVSFVLPLPGENEVAHVQLVTESIVVNRQNTPASTDFDQIIGKSIDVRGVAVSLDRLQIAGDLDPQMLLERQPGGLVLNPMYFNSELKLCISSTGVMNVDMQIKLRNTEISLNLYQLRLAQEVLVYNTGESMRYTFRHLRPRVSVLANPKLWWQFAVKAVIHLMRHRDGGDSIGGSSSWSRKESVIAMRRRYQQLYKRHLENRLLTLRYPEEYAKFVAKHTDKSHSSALGVTYDPLRSPFLLLAIEEKWVQMHADEVQMDELHTFFSAKDILLYRAAVRQKTRKDRVSLSQALYSGVNGNSKHGSWFSVFSSPIASEDNIEKEILQLCLEFDRNTTAGTCSEVGSDEDAFALDITVSIPRIALCVSSRGAEKEDVSSPPRKHSFRGIPRTVTPPQKGQRGVSPKKRGESEDRFGVGDHTLFTFALYGVYTSLTKDQRHDRIIHLKLGSVVIFGVNGMNIVTIGSAEDTDRWLQDDDSRPEQLAIDSSFQWRQQGGERKGGFGSDIANSDSDIETDVEMSEVSKLSRGSKIHCVIAVTISTVKIHWDEQTHALFSKIKSDMLSQFLHLDKPKLFVAEKASCAQLSMNKSCLMDLSADVKFSVEINVQGVMFECPCVDPSSSDSTNHRFYQVGHTRQRYTEGRKSNKNLIRVLIRSFKVSGGDFLPMAASYAKLEESLQSIPTKNLWSSVDFLIEVLLSKLYCSVVHPFVYSVNAIELQFVTITTAPIANSTEDLSKKISIGDLALTEEVVVITGRPWSVACVVSPCVVRSHPIFPALRLDIFCSPLKLTLSMENMPAIVRTINFLMSYAIPCESAVDASRHLSPLQAPRIRNLAPLCKSRINFHLDLFDVRINTTGHTKKGSHAISAGRSEKHSNVNIMRKLLNGLVDTIFMCGVTSIAAETKIRLCEERLFMLSTKSRYVVNSALASLVQCLASGAKSTESAREIDVIVTLLGSDIESGIESAHELFGALVTGIHCNVYSLTYDSKVTIQVEEMIVSDCDGYSVCCVKPILETGNEEACAMANHLYQFGDGTMTMGTMSGTYPGVGNKRIMSSFARDISRNRDDRLSRRRDSIGRRSHRSSTVNPSAPPGSPVRTHRSKRIPRTSDVDVEATIHEQAGQSHSRNFAAYCGLVVTFMEQDKNAGWGAGGDSVSKLYDSALSAQVLGNDVYDTMNVPFRLREKEITADIKSIRSVVSPNGLVRFASDVVPIFILSYPLLDRGNWDNDEKDAVSDSSFNEGYEDSDNSDNSSDLPTVSSRNAAKLQSKQCNRSLANSWRCYQLVVQSCLVCAVLEDRILAVAQIRSIDVEWRQTRNLSRDQIGKNYRDSDIFDDNTKVEKFVKWLSSSHLISVGTICLHDVSEEGRRHVDVLWKDPKTTAAVLLISGVSNEKKSSFNICISGLRCTFLWRFLWELIHFSLDHVYIPIKVALESCLANLNSTQRFRSDSTSPPRPQFHIESKTPNFDLPSVKPSIIAKMNSSYAGRSAVISPNYSDSSDDGDSAAAENESKESESKRSNSILLEDKVETFWARVWKTKWVITLLNTTVILPRNSRSEDLACLTVREMILCNRFAHEAVTAPPPVVSSASKEDMVRNGMHFDIDKNVWLWKTSEVKDSAFPVLNHVNSTGADTFVACDPQDGLILLSDDPIMEGNRRRLSTEGSVASSAPQVCRVPFSGSDNSYFCADCSPFKTRSCKSSSMDSSDDDFESCYGSETDIPELGIEEQACCSDQSSITLVKGRDSFLSFPASSTNNDSDEFVDALDHISMSSEEELELLKRYYSDANDYREVPKLPGDNMAAKRYGGDSEFDSYIDADDWTINTEAEDNATVCGAVFRLAVSFTGVHLFASVYAPLAHFNEPPILSAFEADRKNAEVKHNGQVYSAHGISHSGGRMKSATSADKTKSRQIWRCISKGAFNMQLVVDTTDTQQKWLITDTNKSSSLSLACTLAEFYLLLSVYFDNFSETMVFFERPGVEKLEFPPRIFPIHPEYGTKEFWEFVRLRTPSFEFLFVREFFKIDCALETESFPMELPCLSFVDLLSKLGVLTPGHGRKHEPIPFADLSLFKTILHTKSDGNVMQVVVSSGGMEIRDTRTPVKSLFPVVLSVFPLLDATNATDNSAPKSNTNKEETYGVKITDELKMITDLMELRWGIPDFDFGLKVGSVGISSVEGIPLTVTYFGIGNTWSTSNVGVDAPSFDLKNLDIVYLVQEYFSMYFRFPHFGHPGKVAHSKIASELWPYGGVDTRIFVTRPHIQMQENPLSSNTQILVISAENGVYFRYLYDSESSLRMDCTITGLSAVLLKSHRLPVVARSYRGSAGSGKGVRTLIESVHFTWTYHFFQPKNHVDVLINIAPVKLSARMQTNRRWDNIPSQNRRPFNAPKKLLSPETRRGSFGADILSPLAGKDVDAGRAVVASPYVDFDGDRWHVKLPPLYVPKTVLPLSTSLRSQNANSAYFVSSYEDVLLATALILDFLGLPNMWAETKTEEPPGLMNTKETPCSTPLSSLFAVVRVSDTKLILVDDVLGLHLPIFQLIISEVAYSFRRSPIIKTATLKDIVESEMLSSAEAAARERASRRNSVPARTKMKMVDDELSPKGYNRSNSGPVPMSASSNSIGSDAGKEEIPASIKKNSKEVTMHLRLYGHSNVSGDYFNNIKKCWEPLVAPFSLACLYEETANRGVGVTLRFTSALRLNISVALVRTLHDALRAVQVANDTARDEYYANKVDDATADGSNRMPRSSDQHENQYRGSLDSYSVMSGQVHSAYSGTSNGPNMSDGTQMLSDNDRMQYFTRTTVTATRKIAATFDNSNAFLMNRRPVRYNHIPTQSLRHNARVGFSILNLTGQPLRYVQYFSSSRATMVHYLDHNQRGLLNFVASKTSIRNNQVVEEQFGHFKQEVLQRFGQKALQSSARRSKEIGHHIAVQICGYKWLSSLQADALGIYFKDLHSILGCLNATTIANDALKKRTLSPGEETDKEIIDWGTKNALKLVTEVRPYNGGRMLLLRSVFAVKNSTTHDINIVTNFTSRMPELPADRKSDHFSLKSGETFFIPLSLINESVLRSNQPNSKSLNREDKGTQLGCLWLRPSSMKPVRSELGPSSQFVKSMTYSGNPIVLKDVLLTSESSQNVMSEESSTLLSDGKFKQLSCALSTRVTDPRGDMFDDNIKDYSAFASDFQDGRDEDLAGDVYGFSAAPVVNSDKLPPFCYNIEVQTSGSDGSNSFLANNDRTGGRFLSMFTSGKSLQDEVSKIPLQYTIVVHPPIVLENLLPMKGIFELIHATHKTVLWSSVISPGKAVPVHTVTLDVPIMLVIILDFCRSTQGLVVHKPAELVREEVRFTDKLQQTIEGFLEEGEEGGVSSIMLSDSVGQRLRLMVENNVGGGGQRNIVIFCPYWLINTSQYTIRLKEDGGQMFPAGTVTSQRDGTRPIISGSHLQGSLQGPGGEYNGEELRQHGPVFLGRPGPLHSSRVKEILNESLLSKYLNDMRFEDTCELATVFNFMEDAHILGSRKVVAQLDESSWSRTFTLESAGVAQVLSVEQQDKGMLELAFKVSNGPGRLANYTKIIRFLPRFVVVNKLPRRVTLMQTNGFTYDDTKMTEVSSDHLTPFHLPSVYGERQVSLQMEGPWMRSVLFDVDHIGTHIFTVKPELNFEKLHVNTRGAPIYDVVLDSGEVGLHFETDWGAEDVIVKRVRPGSFAARKTDIQPGDVLIAIDAEEIDGSDFEGTMTILKQKQASEGCVLKFLTIEAKLQNIRGSAINWSTQYLNRHETVTSSVEAFVNPNELAEISVRLEMRPVDATVFMILSEYDKTSRPEYRIDNMSACHVIEYKQKGAALGAWIKLGPGCSANYIWDNPFKPHKLLVRVVKNLLCPMNSIDTGELSKKQKPTNQNNSSDQVHYSRKQRTEDLTLSVQLDDIKWHGFLHIPQNSGEGKLVAQIQSEGMTKILKISLDQTMRDTEYKYSHDFTASQIDALDILKMSIDGLRPNQTTVSNSHMQGEQIHISATGLSSFEDVLNLRLNQSLDEIQNLQSRLLEAQRCLLDTDTTNLASVTSFDSVIGTTITKQDQILIEVLEGKKLKAVSYGTSLESYCEVYLKGNYLRSGLFSKKFVTSTCDGTMDPSWTNQKFVFDVPVLPSDSIRGNSVRINIKTKNLLGDNWVGQADIQLTSLVHENVLIGWFPLRPHKSAIAGAAFDELQHNGSVKLRVEWVHSNEALQRHLKTAIKSRRDELAQLLVNLEASLERILQSKANIPRRGKYYPPGLAKQSTEQMNDVLRQLKDINDGLNRDQTGRFQAQLSRKRALTATTKLLGLVSESSNSLTRTPKKQLSHRNFMNGASNIDINDNLSDLDDDDFETPELPRILSTDKSPARKAILRSALDTSFGLKSPSVDVGLRSNDGIGSSASVDAIPKAPRPLSQDHFVRPDELHPLSSSSAKKYLQIYNSMAYKKVERNEPGISNACVALGRRDDVIVQDNNYINWFDEESNRNYMNILSMAGTVEITAIQALHLPVSNRPVFVKINYGGVTARTTRTPPTAHPAWVNEEDFAPGAKAPGLNEGEVQGDESTSASRRQSHAKSFTIDTFNSKGVFHLSVMVDDFPHNKEIAKLDISVFNLLDCISTLDIDDVYDMWFPLSLTQDSVRTDGDIGCSFSSWSSEKKASHHFGYHSCIRLQFKWKPSRITALSLVGKNSSDFYARIQLPYLSVAVVDSIRVREVFQMIISDVEARHTRSEAISESSLTVQWLQVDNQLPNPIALVILAPTPAKYPQPVLRFYIKQNYMLSHKNLQCFDVIELIIQALDLRLEQETVMALWDVVKSCRQQQKATESEYEVEERDGVQVPIDKLGFSSCLDVDSRDFLSAFSRADGKEKAMYEDDMDKIYIDRFQIGPMKINVSFIMTPSAVRSSNRIIADSHASMSQLDDSGLYAFFWQVGEVVLDLTSTITDAPIKLGVIQADNVFKTWSEFTSTLQSHYLNSALGQMYKIVGSLDLVGNPVGLLSSLGTGVKDFFYEPGHALITSPTEISKIGRGVVKGTVSLLVNTSDGFIGTATTMTRSFGKGIAALSMDNAFLRNREALQRHPNGIMATVARPFKDIANGVYCGLVGIVRVPYHSVKRHGAAGLLPGIAKGLAGVPAKPVVGVLDALTHSGDALRDLVKELAREPGEPAFRRSLSNLFGPDGRLMPYSFEASYGAYVLRIIDEYYKEKTKSKSSKRHSLINKQLNPRGSMDSMNDIRVERAPSINSMDGGGDDSFASGRKTFSCLPFRNKHSAFSAQPADNDYAPRLSGDLMDDELSPSTRVHTVQKQKSFGVRDRSSTNYVGGSQLLQRRRANNSDVSIDRRGKGAIISYVHETVVYTAVVNRGPAKDTLVVITNCRVVVAICRWDAHGIFIDCKWDSDISTLKKPTLKNSGGGSVILQLTATSSRVADGSAEDDYCESISGDNNVILHLFNCLNTVLLHFDAMNTVLLPAFEGDRWREDVYGVIHIGPWEYSRTLLDDGTNDAVEKSHLDTHVVADLELVEWVMTLGEDSHHSQQFNTPEWLMEYCRASCQAHSRVRQFIYLSAAGRDDSNSVIRFKQMLHSGKISGTEFTELMKSDAMARGNNDIIGHGGNRGRYSNSRQASEMRDSDGNNSDDEDSKRPSNLARFANKFLKKTRKSRSNRNVDNISAVHEHDRFHDRSIHSVNLGRGRIAARDQKSLSPSTLTGNSTNFPDSSSPQSLFSKVFSNNFKKSQQESGGASSSISTRTAVSPRELSPINANDSMSPPRSLEPNELMDDNFDMNYLPSFNPSINRSISDSTHTAHHNELKSTPPQSPTLKGSNFKSSFSLGRGNYDVFENEDGSKDSPV